MKKLTKQGWKGFRSGWGSFSKLFLLRRTAQAPLRVELVFCCWLLASNCWLTLTAGAQQPVVNADHSVTFTVKVPGAKKMVLVLSKEKYKMERQGDTFTYHTASLPSEMYTYYYLSKGKQMLDPENSRVTRDIGMKLNFFFVEGDVADYYLDKDVPHGKIDKVWYPSTLNGMSQRRMFVYTPPGYDSEGEDTYPVLYLLHGSGGDETSWADYGRACQILDNMIHQDSIQPMIVVMPNGNIELDAAPGESPYMSKEPTGNNISSWLGKYEKLFVHEIVQYTEKHYRVKADKQHRAIAGLSMGGLHTLFIALNNPDMFDCVGLFSAQTSNMLNIGNIYKMERFNHNIQRFRNAIALMTDKVARPITLSDRIGDIDIYNHLEDKLHRQFEHAPRLYYIAIGRDDFLKKMNREYRAILDKHGYPYTFVESDGDHSWKNWRRYLVDFIKRM